LKKLEESLAKWSQKSKSWSLKGKKFGNLKMAKIQRYTADETKGPTKLRNHIKEFWKQV